MGMGDCTRSNACLAVAVLVTACGHLNGAEPTSPGDHPAFRQVVRSPVPVVRGAARTDIDRFMLVPLEAKGLALNPEADRRTLIRRVSFDLTGLPPTPGEIGSFLADKTPDAYERMLEHYLASPRYGERWGK